jgi:hypothetical protein
MHALTKPYASRGGPGSAALMGRLRTLVREEINLENMVAAFVRAWVPSGEMNMHILRFRRAQPTTAADFGDPGPAAPRDRGVHHSMEEIPGVDGNGDLPCLWGMAGGQGPHCGRHPASADVCPLVSPSASVLRGRSGFAPSAGVVRPAFRRQAAELQPDLVRFAHSL